MSKLLTLCHNGESILRFALTVAVLVFSVFSTSVVMAGDPLEGRAIYTAHCAGCHGGNGRAVVAGTPDLAGATTIMVKPDNKLMATISNGKNIMPAFQGRLSQKEMLDVIAYIRTFF